MIAGAAPAEPAHRSGRLHLRRLLVGVLAVVVAGALANLLGWNVSEWFEQLWAAITGISAEYVIAACVAGLVQTTATAIGWWSILRYGFPGAGIPWRQVWAAYAASVALNGILPANLGTLMLLLMFTTLIAGATFAAVLGGYAVQKIFYCVFGAFPYLYLFLTVAGSFDIKFAFVHEHPWATAIVLIGGGLLIAFLVRAYWPRVVRWWAEAKGGRRDSRPPAGLLHGRLPARGGQLDRDAVRDRRVSRRLCDPGHVRHPDACRCRELDRECDLGDARRRGRDAGVQRRLAPRSDDDRELRPPFRSRSS